MSQSNPSIKVKSRLAPNEQQTSQSLVLWKRYEPHSDAWFTQALKRYASEKAHIQETQSVVTTWGLRYFCFACQDTHHLADYAITSDKTQTFRYCKQCAENVKQNGTNLMVLQTIEEPSEEEEQSLFDSDEPTTNAGQTIMLPETRIATRAAPNMHPMFYIGAGLFIAFLFVMLLQFVAPAIANTWANITYETPRISQLDIQYDGQEYHMVAQNLRGTIFVIAEPYNNLSNMHEYAVTKASSADLAPIIKYDGMNTVYVYVGDAIFAVKLGK